MKRLVFAKTGKPADDFIVRGRITPQEFDRLLDRKILIEVDVDEPTNIRTEDVVIGLVVFALLIGMTASLVLDVFG